MKRSGIAVQVSGKLFQLLIAGQAIRICIVEHVCDAKIGNVLHGPHNAA